MSTVAGLYHERSISERVSGGLYDSGGLAREIGETGKKGERQKTGWGGHEAVACSSQVHWAVTIVFGTLLYSRS